MEEHANEAVYAGSDRSFHDPTMATGIDNDILLNGSVKDMSPGMSCPSGPDALKGLLESEHQDVNLWLEHTRFFDIDYRHKVLEGLRKLKAIDEQRSELLLEIQNVAGPMITPSSVPLQRKNSIASTAPMPTPTLSQAEAGTATPHSCCNGRAAEEGTRKPAMPTADEIRRAVCCRDDAGPRDGLTGIRGGLMVADQRNGASPISHVHHPDRYVAAASSLYAPMNRECLETESIKHLQSQPANEMCRCDGGHGVGADAPRMSVMNGNPEIRYFLVKSFNTMNVEMSQRDGLWITKAKNGPLFTEAFNQSKLVILFFSINKSKAFQGYARMVTAPRSEIPKAEWMGNIDWETSNAFRIEWVNTRRTEFWKFGDLRNPLNDGTPVFVGRDGQEYPEDCGLKLMEAMDRGAEKRSSGSAWAAPQPWDNNGDQARSDSREGSRRGDKSNWRRTKPSSMEGAGLENGDGADSQDNMNLIDY